MYKVLEVGGKFPWVRVVAKDLTKFPPALVKLSDGRLGVIHHYKADGNFGVRPITVTGEYYPNTSPHWSDLDRMKIPEEVSVGHNDLIPVLPNDIPSIFQES